MLNCSAYWNFLFTARIPRCPVRLSRLQLPAPLGVHSQSSFSACRPHPAFEAFAWLDWWCGKNSRVPDRGWCGRPFKSLSIKKEPHLTVWFLHSFSHSLFTFAFTDYGWLSTAISAASCHPWIFPRPKKYPPDTFCHRYAVAGLSNPTLSKKNHT